MDQISAYMGKGNAILGAVMLFAPFILVLVIILIAVIRGMILNHRNNRAQVLTVEATIVDLYNPMDTVHRRRRTSFYAVTFSIGGTEKMIFQVTAAQYKELALGDRGNLSFQGSRYVSFRKELQ